MNFFKIKSFRTGTIEGNISRILGLEPEILQANRYHLTVHCPYRLGDSNFFQMLKSSIVIFLIFRPFEGHMMDIKKHIPHLGFDVESIRQDAYKFFDVRKIFEFLLKNRDYYSFL